MVPARGVLIPISSSCRAWDRSTSDRRDRDDLTFVLRHRLRCGASYSGSKELREARWWTEPRDFGAFVRVLAYRGTRVSWRLRHSPYQAWNEFIIRVRVLNTPEKHDDDGMARVVHPLTLRGTDGGPLMAGATLAALRVGRILPAVQRRISFADSRGGCGLVAAIELIHLSKLRNEVAAVRDLNLDVAEGEFMVWFRK